MSTPFSAQTILTYPPDEGVAQANHTNTVSSQYDKEVSFKFVLTGAGTQEVDFGSILTTGAKAVQVEVAADAQAPVMVQINGGITGRIEVSAGGHFSLASPSPTSNGVLLMSLVHTLGATVRVRILG